MDWPTSAPTGQPDQPTGQPSSEPTQPTGAHHSHQPAHVPADLGATIWEVRRTSDGLDDDLQVLSFQSGWHGLPDIRHGYSRPVGLPFMMGCMYFHRKRWRTTRT